jgi:hypothetical protein
VERARTSCGVPEVGGALEDGVALDVAVEVEAALVVASVDGAGADRVHPASTTAPVTVRNCLRRTASAWW